MVAALRNMDPHSNLKPSTDPSGFKSAGVHRLEMGIEVLGPGQHQAARFTAEIQQPLGQMKSHGSSRVPWLDRHRREQDELRAQGQGQGANTLWPQRAIPADNLGFALLRKAGWQEGSGLGASEQGRVVPIQAWAQKGNRGIGFDQTAAKQQKQQQANQQGKASNQTEAKRKEAACAREVGRERKRLIDKMVEDELTGEDTATKVKKFTQVQLQEEEDAKRRDIGRYLSRALNDPMDMPFSTGDSNPLGRNHRLSALNPLLDDDY